MAARRDGGTWRAEERSAPASTSVRFPIRTKVLAAVLIPLVAAVVLSVLQVTSARSEQRRVEELTGLAGAATAPGGLVDALIAEQGVAASAAAATQLGSPSSGNIDQAYGNTDRAIRQLQVSAEESGEAASQTYRNLLESIDVELALIRSTAAESAEEEGLDAGLAGKSYSIYTDLIQRVRKANEQLSAQIDDRQLRQAATVLDEVNRVHLALSVLVYDAAMSDIGERDADLASRDLVLGRLLEYRAAVAALQARSNGPWRAEVAAFTEDPRYKELDRTVQASLDGQRLDRSVLLATRTAPGSIEDAEPGTPMAVAAVATATMRDRIDRLEDEARATTRNRIVALFGIILVTAIAAYFVARSLTRPMRELVGQVRTMAETTLPAAVEAVRNTPRNRDPVIPAVPPISVNSRDEIQNVADAVNHVQASAISLAVSQAQLQHTVAESMVGLGRRTQNLIGMQMALISELEQNELDPDRLAKLYRLDHLATRTRRNAESLVVLSGDDFQHPGTEASSIRDVVRGALGEVEDYQRVDLADLDPAGVGGPLAADLVHLLAELIENALAYSPPTSRVEVRGQLSSAGYTLVVLDHGLGMSDAEFAIANARLSNDVSFTAAPARHLGHFVVGRLAARCGVRVQLLEGADGGVGARVAVPMELLLDVPEPEVLGLPAEVASTSSLLLDHRPAERNVGTAALGPLPVPTASAAAQPEPAASVSEDRVGASAPVPEPEPLAQEVEPDPVVIDAGGPVAAPEPAAAPVAAGDAVAEPESLTGAAPPASPEPVAPPEAEPLPDPVALQEPEPLPVTEVGMRAPEPAPAPAAAPVPDLTRNGLTKRVRGRYPVRSVSLERGPEPEQETAPAADLRNPALTEHFGSVLEAYTGGLSRGQLSAHGEDEVDDIPLPDWARPDAWEQAGPGNGHSGSENEVAR